MLLQWCRARTCVCSDFQAKSMRIKNNNAHMEWTQHSIYPKCILRSVIMRYFIYAAVSAGE